MGNRSAKGSLSPPLIRTNNSPKRDAGIHARLYDDYVVLEQSHSVVDLRTKGIAIDPVSSNLYVCDESTHTVRVFSSKFDRLFAFTGVPLHYPWGICISNDRVFVTEHYIAAISVFTLEGNRISTCSFNHTKSPKSNLSFPSGIAVGEDGDIYICDESNHRIFVLTHDEYRFYEFARSSLKSPRDIKLHQDNVIVLDLFDELKKSVYADKMVLRVYSKKEELLKLIRLEHLSLIGFFDVTPNSNYVIGSFNCIRFVSKKGEVLKTYENKFDLGTVYQPGIALDNKTMDIVGLSLSEGKPLTFYRYRIKD